MSALRNYLNKIKPNFQEGGKLHAFESVFDGFESFPSNTLSKACSLPPFWKLGFILLR